MPIVRCALQSFMCLLLLCVSGRPLQVAVRPMLSDRCPHVLSVTLVYCGQTCGWIKMALGTEVGLGPGDIGLDGDRAPPRMGGGTADSPTFRPVSIVAKRSPISATAELLFYSIVCAFYFVITLYNTLHRLLYF